MTPEDQDRLRGLLLGQRLLALGVALEGEPVVGLLPYAVAADASAIYVQASRLARHSRGLEAGGRFSAVVHEPDSLDMDPLQVPRLLLEGLVARLAGGSPDFAPAARTFLARFPAAAQTLQLGDFALYRLELETGRLVLGFGRALNLDRSHFAALAAK